MNNLMKKPLLIATLSTCLISTELQAAEKDSTMSYSRKVENTGAGMGLIIGGVLGGPPGAIISAGLGAWLGKEVGGKKELEIALAEKEQELYALRELHKNQQRALAKHIKNQLAAKVEACMEAQNADSQAETIKFDTKLAATPYICGNELVMAVQFRTGSSDIESHYDEQLLKIAKTIKNLPQLQVAVEGYADRRGESDDNKQLSSNRAQAVKRYLLKHGIPASRIAMASYGESKPLLQEQSVENDFFDRRVMLRLVPPSAVAANQ